MNHKLYGLTLGLVMALASTASAEQAGLPSDAALAAMGLSDMQVMSDTDAMAIRGHGFQNRRSFVLTAGASAAYITLPPGAIPIPPGGAGSIQLNFAVGTFNASSGSLAVAGYTKITEEDGPGLGNTHTTTRTVIIGAGGASWGKAF